MDPSVFICGDGYSFSLLDGLCVFSSPFLARAAWNANRTAVWRAWHDTGRVDWPPHAAKAYDGIEDNTADLGWPIRSFDQEELQGAVQADAASVERFRRGHPREAEEIAEYLDDYLSYQQTLLAIAQEVGDDEDAARRAAGEHFLLTTRRT